MSGFSYDKERVAQSIQELSAISNEIKQIAPDVESGLSIIRNARGINYIDWKKDSVNSFVQDCNDVLDELLTNLNNQVSAIEAYKEGQEGSFFKRLGATAVMVYSKLREGELTFLEQLGDAVVGLVGFAGGIFFPKFGESVSEFVAKDLVGDWFNERYTSNNAFSAWVDKYSWDWMKYDSCAASILKGVGTAAPTIILALATAGSSLAVTGTVAAVSGTASLGGKLQSELQDGTDYSKAIGKSLLTGITDAGLTFALSSAKGAASAKNSLLESSKTLTKVNQLKSGAKDIVVNIANKTGLSKVASKITSSKAGNMVINLMKKTKPVNMVTKAGKAIKDTARITVETIAKNPKVATAVAAGTAVIYTGNKINNVSNGTPSTKGSENENDLHIDTPEPKPEPNPDPDYTVEPAGKDNKSSNTGNTGTTDIKTNGNTGNTNGEIDTSPQQRRNTSNNGNGTNSGNKNDGNGSNSVNKNDGNGSNSGNKNDVNGSNSGNKNDGNGSSSGNKNDGNGTSNENKSDENGSNNENKNDGDSSSNENKNDGNGSNGGNKNDNNGSNSENKNHENESNDSDKTGGQPVQQPSNQPSDNNTQPSSSGYTPPSNNGGSYGNYTDTSYTPDTSTDQIPSDTIEILDDGTGDDMSTTTDTTDEPYDEPYIVEPPVDTTTTTTSKKSMAGPILTGIGLAGAAGVGAKVYLDKKKQSESGEFDETVEDDDEDNSIVTDEWKDDNDSDSPGYEDNSSDYNSTPNYEDNSSDYEYPVD